MSKIKVNGKEVSREEAIKQIDDPNTKIESLTVGLKNKKRKKSKPSHEGFAIAQDFVSSMSRGMTEFNASRIVASFKESPKIMGRNMYIIMADPGDEINEILEALSSDVEVDK